MIKKIDHINISVSDIEKSKRFFIDLLGFKLDKEWIFEGSWIEIVTGLSNVKAKCSQLIHPNSEANIELIQYLSPIENEISSPNKANQIGFRHISFEVEDIEKMYKKLLNANVKFASEIQTFNNKHKLCYFYGPDNIIIEIAENK